MAIITGSLASVNSVPTEGTVLVRALTLRPGSTFAVTGEPKVAVIKAGRFVIEDVEPGPVQLTIQGNGVTHDVRVDVPDEEEVDFLDLLDDVYDWEPEQISAVKLAAREARKAADEARAIAEYFGDVAEVETLVADAHTQAAAASEHANRAAGHDQAAAAHADRAEAAQGGAERAEAAAQESASGAEESRSLAGVHATAAGASEAAAEAAAADSQASRDAAAVSAGEAAESAQRAASERGAAEAARDLAGASATEAATEAVKARSAADGAAADVRDKLSGYVLQAEAARDESEHHADLSEGSAVRAEAAALSAEAVVAEGVPRATDQVAGAVMLTGDLGGTYDTPTVPGLADKADLDEVQGTIDAVDSSTSSATPGTIARRSAQGTLSVGAPTASDHAATRQYVADQVATRAPLSDYNSFRSVTNQALGELSSRVDSRPALFSGPGGPPASIPGAAVGDWWLDVDTMEIYRITGV